MSVALNADPDASGEVPAGLPRQAAGEVSPCRQNPELFVDPATRRDFERAQQACRTQCAVRARCLATAVASHAAWGLWGGEWFTEGLQRQRFHKPRS